tara:strand:- start:5771 stop:6178 length:408 start_codon:yes stop_codon:yes gene_type:complete
MDKPKMTPEEAYKKLQEALKNGQAGLDALPEEVKTLAMGPAADSVKDVGTRSGTDEGMKVLGDFPKELQALEAFDKPRQVIQPAATEALEVFDKPRKVAVDLLKSLEDSIKTTDENDLEKMKSIVEGEMRLRSKM